MEMVLTIILAVFFALMYWKRKKARGAWLWILFVLCIIPTGIAYRDHFIRYVPFAYCVFCLWIGGMIVPWYVCKKKGLALIWTAADLVSLPSVLLAGISCGTSIRYAILTVCLYGLLAVNAVSLLLPQKRKEL